MNLRQAIEDLESLDTDATIVARRPWSVGSDAKVVAPSMLGPAAPDVRRDGLEYFLEVSVAREVLEVFGDRTPSEEEKVACLVFYAENDAFPAWVYP